MEAAISAETGSEAAVGLSFGNDACFLTLEIEFCNRLRYQSVKKWYGERICKIRQVCCKRKNAARYSFAG